MKEVFLTFILVVLAIFAVRIFGGGNAGKRACENNIQSPTVMFNCPTRIEVKNEMF